MEGVRRRRPGGGGGDEKVEPVGREGGGGRSASIDHSCTYLILLVAVSLASCCLLVWLLGMTETSWPSLG